MKKAAAGVSVALVLVIAAVSFPYRRLARRVDLQLTGNVQNTINFYSASEVVAPGDPMAANDLAAALGGFKLLMQFSNGKIPQVTLDLEQTIRDRFE